MAFSLNFIGASAFALFPSYPVALGSLFIIGIGVVMLQVITNPLIRVEENFAFYPVLSQVIFGLVSFNSPYFLVAILNPSARSSLKMVFTQNLRLLDTYTELLKLYLPLSKFLFEPFLLVVFLFL